MSLQPSVEAIDGRPDVDNASTKRRRMSDDERLVRREDLQRVVLLARRECQEVGFAI